MYFITYQNRFVWINGVCACIGSNPPDNGFAKDTKKNPILKIWSNIQYQVCRVNSPTCAYTTGALTYPRTSPLPAFTPLSHTPTCTETLTKPKLTQRLQQSSLARCSYSQHKSNGCVPNRLHSDIERFFTFACVSSFLSF